MQNTLFSPDSCYSSKWYIFKNTELGRIHDCIDWDSLIELLPQKKTLRGAPSWLPAKGLFGLMFLKHYTGLSDEKLVARFNTDWAMQFFCGVQLSDNESIKDNAFASRVRSYLGKHVDFEQFQQKLLRHWKPEIPSQNVLMMDATCYEVHLRFPTDIKLLWESCCWLWENTLPALCKTNNIKIPRSKVKEIKVKYLVYSKLRKKPHRKTKVIKRALLGLLYKGIDQLQQVLNQTKANKFTARQSAVFRTIKQVYSQQKHHFDYPKVKIKDRIVSIHKPYIRPIVRGKENKPVEFGLKVHKAMVGGISILEHVSYSAFNECKRLKISTLKHRMLFGSYTHLSADRIYATNENRRYMTASGTQTNFIRKGGRKDDKPTKQIKAILNKERSTVLEGSFGTEKEHYGLRKIRARSSQTEIAWLYFGVFTANAVKISKRRRVPRQSSIAA